MIYANILLILFIAMLVSFIIGKDMEDVLPPCLFVFLLMLYGIAILGKSHHSYLASILVFGAIWVYYIAKNKRIIPKLKDIKSKLFTPGFILYLAVIVVMFIAYCNHFVTVWDDFHYNATFPKDMYYYGTMPTGFKSATFYRSYLPLMQMFFYWGFQGIRDFSEPLMFQYKMFLIYTCLLPIFKQVNEGKKFKRISAGIIATLLPFSFMYELMESLSMDTFMACIFGYALVVVLYEKRDWFTYVKIASSLLALSLVKQISPIFVAVVFGTWFVKDLVLCISDRRKSEDNKLSSENRVFYKNEIIAFICSGALSGIAIISWKIFCNIKGNTVYLSNKLSESTAGGLFVLPDYGKKTIHDFIISIAIQNMSLAFNGMSLALVLVVSIVMIGFIVKLRKGDEGIYAGYIVIGLGLIGYLAVLLYTYIFVFEPWEAESLSSIDRYFGTYAIVLIYVPLMGLMQKSSAKVTGINDVRWERYSLIITSAIVILTLPVTNMISYLIPPVYNMVKAEQLTVVNGVKEEVLKVNPASLETRTVLMVTNEENTLYARDVVYNLIPLVPTQLLVTPDMGDMSQEVLNKCEDEHVYYVYFPDKFIDDIASKEEITRAIKDETGPEKGKLYYYDEEEKIIKPLE